MVVLLMVGFRTFSEIEHGADCPGNDTDQERACYCPPEPVDGKASDNGSGQLQKQGVDDEKKKPERYNDERNGEKYENGSDDCVDEAEHKGDQDCRPETFDMDAVQYVCGCIDRKGVYEPLDQDAHYRDLLVLIRRYSVAM
jgi:hypothetical protein